MFDFCRGLVSLLLSLLRALHKLVKPLTGPYTFLLVHPKHLKNLQQTLEKSILCVKTSVFYIFVCSIDLYKKCPKNTPRKGPYIGLYKAM